jgi:hypothetical protein
MKRLIAAGLITAALVVPPAASAFAAPNPSGTGQPSQSCEVQPASPPGFNTSGFNNATNVYAGSQPQNSKNSNSVSQYDVACYQVSQPR